MWLFYFVSSRISLNFGIFNDTSCYAPTSQCYLPEIQQLKKNTGFSVSQIQRIRVCDYIKNHKLENDVVVFLFTLWMDKSKKFTLVAWIVCGDGQIMRSCCWGVLLKGLENPYRPYVCVWGGGICCWAILSEDLENSDRSQVCCKSTFVWRWIFLERNLVVGREYQPFSKQNHFFTTRFSRALR